MCSRAVASAIAPLLIAMAMVAFVHCTGEVAAGPADGAPEGGFDGTLDDGPRADAKSAVDAGSDGGLDRVADGGSEGASGRGSDGGPNGTLDGARDLDACPAGSSLYFTKEGCNARPVCVSDLQDACAQTFCGCDGVVYMGGCGSSSEPFQAHSGCLNPDAACPDSATLQSDPWSGCSTHAQACGRPSALLPPTCGD